MNFIRKMRRQNERKVAKAQKRTERHPMKLETMEPRLMLAGQTSGIDNWDISGNHELQGSYYTDVDNDQKMIRVDMGI